MNFRYNLINRSVEIITFILSTDQFAQICHVNLKKAMCYSLCILLGAPSREEPLEVVLDLRR